MTKADTATMSLAERLFHACLFEMGAVVLTVLVFKLMNDGHLLAHSLPLSVTISLIAVVWNMVFNWLFDKVVKGERLHRSLKIRLVHACLFEGVLFLITVPLIAWVLQVSLWQALLMDIGIVAVIGVYTLLFNWAYDWFRFWLNCGK